MGGVKLRIREVLDSKGKSIQWLSEQLGITYANTNNIVNGKSNPSLDRLNEIAEKLGVPIIEMFERQPQKGDNEFKCPNCGVELELKKKE